MKPEGWTETQWRIFQKAMANANRAVREFTPLKLSDKKKRELEKITKGGRK